MTDAPQRVIAYIDGFNVYHGLKEKKWERFLWLDYRALLERLVRPDQVLVEVKYFTARMTKPPDRQGRQAVYLDALDAHGGVDVIEGTYREKGKKCPKCMKWHKTFEEKKTDVNIAAHLVADAYEDRFDTAWLVCADADLCGALEVVATRLQKRVVVVCPPGRLSEELVSAAAGSLHLRKSLFVQSQLPDPVIGIGGIELSRPASWV